MSERAGLARSVRPVFFPLDQRLKLKAHQQITWRLERLTCEVGVRLPHRQAAAVLRELRGVPMTSKQVSRITSKHGQRAIEQRSAEVQVAWRAPAPLGKPLPGPPVLYIEADGAWINSRERLHIEGKVGLVHQGPEPIGRNRMQLRSGVYVTTFEDSERLGEELYLEADRQGLEQAGLVVMLGDGAKWIRELHQTHFPMRSTSWTGFTCGANSTVPCAGSPPNSARIVKGSSG